MPGPTFHDSFIPEFRRNAGVPYDSDWFAALNPGQNRVPKPRDRELDFLTIAVQCMDLTSLTGTESEGEIKQLCDRAKQALGDYHDHVKVAAVCVYDAHIATAKGVLQDSGIRVAAVTAGFPIPLLPLSERLEQIRWTVDQGADEIDVVINKDLALAKDWEGVYAEIKSMREACGSALLKLILATGDLDDPVTIREASMTAMMAGADFIKTSTGRETINATLEACEVMASAIADYAARTGFKVGLKPAGGIRTANQAMDWVSLVQDKLCDEWLQPRLFRIGASSLLEELADRLGRSGA